MIFLADENVDAGIIHSLRQERHVVFSVAEMQPSIADEAVLNLANTRKAVLITADKDFGELVFRQELLHSGLILIRLVGKSSHEKAKIVSSVVQQHKDEFNENFTVVTPHAVRIRRRIL